MKEKDGFIEGQINIEGFDKFRSQEAQLRFSFHLKTTGSVAAQNTSKICRFCFSQKSADATACTNFCRFFQKFAKFLKFHKKTRFRVESVRALITGVSMIFRIIYPKDH